MKKHDVLSAIFALVCALGLLRYAPQVGDGVRTGLQNCAGLLIPSLFPFMILAALVGATHAGEHLSQWVAMLVHPITGLPKKIGASFFMSFLGGFPVGAQMLSRQLEAGEIDEDMAGRALCCCVNAGPSFLISAVGSLFNPAAGLLLLAAQVLSSFCIAAITFHGFVPAIHSQPKTVNRKDALVESVRGAAAGMFGICAFVVTFSALTALLRACGLLGWISGVLGGLFPAMGSQFFESAITGIMEVTNGCIAAAALPGGFLLCAFLVSFSSLSIIFQVKSCFTRPIPYKRFYGSRLLHGFFTACFAGLGQRLFPKAVTAAAIAGTPIMSAHPNTLVSTLCLMGMCTILLFTPRSRQGKC